MEQIQEHIELASFSRNAPFKRLSSLRFVFILVAGFSLTSLGMMTFGHALQAESTVSDPFLEYRDLFPGHMVDTLDSRTFSCVNVYRYLDQSAITCRVTLSSGIFSNIDIIVEKGVIHTTTFMMRGNTLKAGDVVLLFGKPHFRIYADNVLLFWNNLFVMVSTTAKGQSTMMRSVWSVTFTDIS